MPRKPAFPAYVLKARRALDMAGAAWRAELRASFGALANWARYELDGEGEPGTALRAAYEGFVAARDASDEATRRMVAEVHAAGRALMVARHAARTEAAA